MTDDSALVDFLEEMPMEDVGDVDLPMPNGMQMRDYQLTCRAAIKEARKLYSRILAVLSTGAGKTVVFSTIAADEVRAGGRVLIIAHTEELLEQARDKLFRVTGIEAEKEKADEHASLSASVVIASVQTLSRDNRLLGFPADHFSLVIIDETHRVLAASYLKIVYYFHFGEESLDAEWTMPIPGAPYKVGAHLLGFTATADRGDRRSLGELFQTCAYEFGLLEACREGYLVRPVVKNIPLQIDLKRRKESDRVMRGNDYNPEFLDERLTPMMKAIATEYAKEVSDRKTVAFLPSVDAAKRLAEACTQAGMRGMFVSGNCPDRAEKVEAFRLAGPGTVLCNAMLLIEGVDIPDISCVSILRPTKIRSLFVQCAGRGSRPLPGVIDGLKTKEQRLAAIAASSKPNMMILDFLWLSDRLDLVQPVDLVATRAEIRDRMAAAATAGSTDLLDMELGATRDLLKSLESAARKHANKAARVIDPLAFAVSLGDESLAMYEPETAWEKLPATDKQLEFLRKNHIDTTNIKYRGHAQKLTVHVLKRFSGRLATALQLDFLKKLHVPAEQLASMTSSQASQAIDAILKDKKQRRLTASVDLPA